MTVVGVTLVLEWSKQGWNNFPFVLKISFTPAWRLLEIECIIAVCTFKNHVRMITLLNSKQSVWDQVYCGHITYDRDLHIMKKKPKGHDLLLRSQIKGECSNIPVVKCKHICKTLTATHCISHILGVNYQQGKYQGWHFNLILSALRDFGCQAKTVFVDQISNQSET